MPRDTPLDHYQLAERFPDEASRVRFWRFVEKGQAAECWQWVGSVAPNSLRPQFSDRHPDTGSRTMRNAARVAYELHHGCRVPKGLFVLSKCRNKRCCNPDHLVLGGASEACKGTERKRKLTAKVVIAIVEERKTFGTYYARLAQKYGVSPRTVQDIVLGRTWAEVTGLKDVPRGKPGRPRKQLALPFEAPTPLLSLEAPA
jgi:hypothetical protein